MDHLIAQVLAIAKRMWKYRWSGVAVAWLAGVIGAVVVFVIPDRYEASARVYVDTQTILRPLLQGMVVQPNIEQQVTMLSRTLISRPNLEKLVHMADLDLKNQSKAQQDVLIDDLTDRLSIQSTKSDNLYTVAFRDQDPEVAKRVVQALVQIFIESSLGATNHDTASAQTFLNDQIKTYEAKLEDAENRRKEFKLRNMQNFSDGKDAATRLGELSAQLDRARLEYREALSARDAAKAQLSSAMGGGGAANSTQSLLQESTLSVSTPDIDARLSAQRSTLDSLLQKYTEQHPDVIAVRKSIKDLEAQRAKEVQELRKAAMAAPTVNGAAVSSSPAVQEMGKLLAENEVQVAALRSRVDDYTARYAQAMAALRTAPQIEAEAAQLDRDYAINKKQYDDLVGRRDSAAISSDLTGAASLYDFRLIDPPRVSPKPVAPNRLLFLAGALVASLLMGLFATFAASQLRPVFHDMSEMRHRLELPILGAVTRLVTEADQRRAKVDLYRFAGASGGLVVLFVVGLTVMAVIASQRVN